MDNRVPAIPQSTYRLQFNAGFGFDQAAALAPYLARLGISHVYASPYLKSRPNSTHGYDIVDHGALSPDLGDAAAFARMAAAFHRHGLGQILDFVPNHMGVGGSDNPLWLNVLEWGPDSAVAGWFDIDWDPDERYLRNKVLVPFLADQYGTELQAGSLRLRFGDDGDFAVWAYDTHKLPINPLDYGKILGDAHPELERLGDAFASLATWRPQIERRATELKAELAQLARERVDVRAAVAVASARFEGTIGDLRSWSALDDLIRTQYWRAAHFRVAADDINYRRFFNINDLAGIRMELPELFEHAHRLVFELLADGTLDGLRIDHVDGLLDPQRYLERLRERMPEPFYLVVEKILAHHEQLRETWPVHGTTGYDFTNLVLGLLIDADNEREVSEAYAAFTGERAPFGDIVLESKLRIMENEMASELNVLARDAARIARQHPRTADFTHRILQRAIKAVVAAFPVYRTYITGDEPAAADRRDIAWAIAQARRRERAVDASVFEFVQQLLTTDLVSAPHSGFSIRSVVRFAMRVQQYSGPVMAKGLEDTAFYRYNRFVALNEVGGSPEQFGISVAAFHQANRQRVKNWPHAMLATSTHDTKRGEDARARLAVLSELPAEWAQNVTAWSRILRARRGDVEAAAPPDANDEYALYQMLVGSWPEELMGTPAPEQAALDAFGERVKAAMVKSMREAKVHSTWAAPGEEYEASVLAFITDALDAERSRAFFASFLPFVERIARLGVENSLVQAVLKCTVPGVPDIYQGSEVWNGSLVDPDNRRPVEYAGLDRLLAHVQAARERDPLDAVRRLMSAPRAGGIKLAVLQTLLLLRRHEPDLFARGSYDEVPISGDRSGELCAFTRTWSKKTVLTAVARFPARRAAQPSNPATIVLPEALHPFAWTDCLTGRTLAPGPQLAAGALFEVLPAAVLLAQPV